MTDTDVRQRPTDRRRVPASLTTILCDADGTLFPSEQPAFVASAVVTRSFAAHFGLDGDYSAEGLRIATTGQNFRSTARTLLSDARVEVSDGELESWVDQERAAVTAHLARVLSPEPDVQAAVTRLASKYQLAAVSSSALSRLRACFRASALDRAFPPERTFSAESSLPVPTSKPDPAIYRFALQSTGDRLGGCPGHRGFGHRRPVRRCGRHCDVRLGAVLSRRGATAADRAAVRRRLRIRGEQLDGAGRSGSPL